MNRGKQPVNGEISDGTTYSDRVLKRLLRFEDRKSLRAWIKAEGIPYLRLNGRWWVAGEELRKVMRAAAETERKADEGDAENPAFVD